MLFLQKMKAAPNSPSRIQAVDLKGEPGNLEQ